MNKTTNYQLNQWEPEDQVRRTDFNEDNARIDAALAGKADKTALAAAQTALTKQISQVDAAMVRMVFGTYTGTGTSSRHIELGVKPKAVLLFQENGQTYSSLGVAMVCGGLALADHPVIRSGDTALSIDSTGFNVFYVTNTSNGNIYVYTNGNNIKYHYIAFV